MRVSDLIHLAARLADVVLSRRLTPLEQAEVATYLESPLERDMFWGQPRADQRHGLQAARSVAARRPDREDLIRAAGGIVHELQDLDVAVCGGQQHTHTFKVAHRALSLPAARVPRHG